MLMGAMPLSMLAQDDLYFVPKKKSVEKSVVGTAVQQPVTISDCGRSVDEYNRRQKSSYEVIDGDTVRNDIIEFTAEQGVYPDSAKEEKDDFELTKKMARFDDYQLAEMQPSGQAIMPASICGAGIRLGTIPAMVGTTLGTIPGIHIIIIAAGAIVGTIPGSILIMAMPAITPGTIPGIILTMAGGIPTGTIPQEVVAAMPIITTSALARSAPTVPPTTIIMAALWRTTVVARRVSATVPPDWVATRVPIAAATATAAIAATSVAIVATPATPALAITPAPTTRARAAIAVVASAALAAAVVAVVATVAVVAAVEAAEAVAVSVAEDKPYSIFSIKTC